MKHPIRTYCGALVAIFLMLPTLSWATFEIINCPVDRTGFIRASYQLGDEENPGSIWPYSASTPTWGKNYQEHHPWPTTVTEWRAYLGFDMSAAHLTPGRWVRKADFYYGPGTFASGGEFLPSLWEVELYGSLANPNNLHQSDWFSGTFAGQITFSDPPAPTWVSLPQSFVDHINFYGGQTMVLRDTSHSSQDGFYAAIPRGCILKVTVEDLSTGGKAAGDLIAGESTATESSTFSQIKALY